MARMLANWGLFPWIYLCSPLQYADPDHEWPDPLSLAAETRYIVPRGLQLANHCRQTGSRMSAEDSIMFQPD
jgi:hypothetical protein